MAHLQTHTFLFLILLTLLSCGQPSARKDGFTYQVGDSEFDPELDDPNFKLCQHDSSAVQYYYGSNGEQYKGEKIRIINAFQQNVKSVSVKQSGYVTIRFVVNCEGRTGRFRIQEMDMNFQPFEFDKRITDQLLNETKKLDGWRSLTLDDSKVDYYQYLTFKIIDGWIAEILP